MKGRLCGCICFVASVAARLFRADWDARLDQGAAEQRRSADLEPAIELAHPFAHAEKSEAELEIGRQADAVILDAEAHLAASVGAGANVHADARRARLRVPRGIGEAFLDDSISRQADILAKSPGSAAAEAVRNAAEQENCILNQWKNYLLNLCLRQL